MLLIEIVADLERDGDTVIDAVTVGERSEVSDPRTVDVDDAELLRECDVETVGLTADVLDVVAVAELDDVADDVAEEVGFTFVDDMRCDGDTEKDRDVDSVTEVRAEAVIEPE